MTDIAIVAGASGLVGRCIVEQLRKAGDWDIIALGRRPQSMDDARWITVDLADAADCQRALGSLQQITHVFYAGRYDHPEGVPESVEINTAMLVNLINTLEPVARLQHVHAVHGSKYYDHQLGPQWDVTSSMEKARTLGFNDAVDTREMFRKQFENYRKEKITP